MNLVLSSKRVKESEEFTINELDYKSDILMERAAVKVAFSVMERFPFKSTKISVICGGGNNGADGLCVARLLLENGYIPSVYYKAGKTDLWLKQMSVLKNIIEYLGIQEDILFDVRDFNGNNVSGNDIDVIIDCLYGIGINRTLSDTDIFLINSINTLTAYKYAVDIPSGLDATTGFIWGACVKVNETICLGALKKGLFIGNGPDCSGKIAFAKIGIFYKQDPDDYILLDKSDIEKCEIIKRVTANKGTYGKTLIIAGSEKIYGAAYLAAKASITSGAGMVKVVTHENNKHSLEHDIPEAMYSFYKDSISDIDLSNDIKWCNTIVAGCGLSVANISKSIIEELLDDDNLADKNMVLDADAINIISEDKKLFEKLIKVIAAKNISCVITPHKKELSRLGNLVGILDEDELCRWLYDHARIITVNKDANTRIYGNGIYINGTGNEGMATAGSGDVLAGILGGLLYRLSTYDITKATAVSVWLHGYCGDIFAKQNNTVCLCAGNLIENIGKALDLLT